MKFPQSSYPNYKKFLVYPARSLKTSHAYIHIIALQVPLLQVAYLLRCLFQPIVMNPESSNEQAIKALQAQNAQFQELVKSLAQGQQDLKTLVILLGSHC